MTTNDVSDTRISDERLEQILAGLEGKIHDQIIPLGLLRSILTELLASRPQSPAEWRVSRDELAQLIHDAGAPPAPPCSPIRSLPETHFVRVRAYRQADAVLALRAASIPAPERSKYVRIDEVLFTTIQDAYLHGMDWGRKYESTEPEEIKASYDYADKTLSALETPPLHKEGEAVYFAEGNTVRKRVGSAFGEGDVLFCTPSAWFPANEVADLLNAVPVPVTITDGPEEQRIEDLRFKAFRTNDPQDRQAYFDAASKWFQDRHYRYAALSQKPGEQG